MQTEVTYVAAHSHADTSYNILKEHTELLEQVSARSPSTGAGGCSGGGW